MREHGYLIDRCVAKRAMRRCELPAGHAGEAEQTLAFELVVDEAVADLLDGVVGQLGLHVLGLR